MKKIDINRFGKVLSRLILVRHRSIVKLFAGFLIGFFVIAIMFLPFFNRQPMSDADIRIRLWGNSPFISVVFAMSFFIIATFIISDLNTRQQRINEMMLPATNLEKFLARVILVSIAYCHRLYRCRWIATAGNNAYFLWWKSFLGRNVV